MKTAHDNSIIIYTDGSSLGNPGPGGFGAVIVFLGKDHVVELGGGIRGTTNNRMELTAIAQSLGYLQQNGVSSDTPITIYTDSSYAINGITKWIHGWQKKKWVTMNKTPVLNVDLWQEIAGLIKHFSKLSFTHVRGHAGVWGNERCDYIATEFASGKSPRLFHGGLATYDSRIIPLGSPAHKKYPAYTTEGTIPVSKTTKSSSKSGKKKTGSGKAYSYVALVNGKIYTFEDWESCKVAVYGRSAKFKKALTKHEEEKLIKEWKT